MSAASDTSLEITLAEFSRDRRPPAADLSCRVTAGILTMVLGAMLLFLATHRPLWRAPDQQTSAELIARLIPDQPRKNIIPPPPSKFLAHLIRPRTEAPAPPVFTVASETLPAPAALPASAAKSSPLAGGVPEGAGMGAQGISANGTNGNGTGLSGCWDKAWAQSITDRIRPFFYYPRRAREQHVSGVVIVHMVIRRSGRLDVLDIGKSSGDDSLDTAAYKMVHNAQPLPRIPDRMHVDRAEGVLPIIFGRVGENFSASDTTCPR